MARRLLRSRALRIATSATLAPAVVVAATGWLYLLRPVGRLGPGVHDALALDELSRRATSPLVLYVVVWAAAAVLVGLLARFAGADGLTAGLVLGPAVGGWLYLLNGVSILVVRQVPAHEAFRAASTEQAVLLPALLVAFAGALLGRQRGSGRDRSRATLAWLVAGVALLAAWDAIFPEHRRSLVAAFDPAQVHGATKAAVAPLAAVLLLAARSLARGSRRAWQVALVVLVALLVLHIGRRFSEGAIVTGVVAVALVARRADFRRRGDPTARPRVLVHAAVIASSVVGYGLVTLWVNRVMVDQPYTLGFALGVVGRAVAGLDFRGADHLSGAFAGWFPLTEFLLATCGLAFVLAEWLAPWRYRLQQQADERVLARTLVRRFGDDTLAPFALRADKSYFFSPDRRAFVAYRVVGGIAIVAGDPIGSPDGHAQLVEAFVEYAHERGWRVAILGASARTLELYRSLGLRVLYHGDEAIVDTRTFSLEGRAIRKVRQSVHRVQRAGYVARALRPGEMDDALRAELETIACEWRGDAPERGFVMALDALFRLDGDDVVFVVGFDGAGRATGFLHFCVAHAGSALSLSTMPRRRDVPNGFNEWLICESIAWARIVGYERVSLNFTPFASLLSPEASLTPAQRLEAAALRRLKGWFQLDNLAQFNRKFFPGWEPRYVVYERRRDLPRVGLAALAAESYLPFR
ncbi:MAG TPA: phosphatidylglycerol lysyltransferase domain-containing protein [Gaiellaceae bacterium]|nr:phosphatidylglycerol lysyltransferase domain-containing protein [Gaiellaceae bacterium]